MIDVPVLIVGGGPVGLSASILLSQQGIRSLLVERHPGTSIHPKARGINARSMEIYRQCGVEQAVRAAGLPPERARFIIWAKTLAGEELERRVPWRSSPQSQVVSSVRNCLCAQDDLEPVLRARAELLGPGELRFGSELTGFEQDGAGVTATIVEGGEEMRVRARYMIAADGAHSRVRDALGIAMLGREAVYESVNVLMRADLSRWVADRPAALYFIENEAVKGTFLTINGIDRWGFLANSLTAYGLTAADFTPERTVALIRTAAGVPDLPVEILGIAPWTASAHVAERYRDGGVFLAGDAAHHMPPTGGFGMNTGIQDVHNLAWKLAGVLDGWAAPALLNTYDQERRPVGRVITEQSLINSASMGRLSPSGQPATGGFARPEYLNEQGMIFGAAYDSDAVIPDGTALPPVANPVTDYVPVARPGSRAPHVWLDRDGERISTLDLFGPGFTLLAGCAGRRWVGAADDLARASGVPLRADEIAPAGRLRDPDGAWHKTYEVEDDGAVLIRPDGHVAWRCRSTGGDPEAMLRDALLGVLGRRAGPAMPGRD